MYCILLAYNLDKLKSQGIAEELCDETVNMGPGNVNTLLKYVWAEIEWATGQKVPTEPKLTLATINWINWYTANRVNRIAFYNSIRVKRVTYYVKLAQKKPSMRQFLLSWVSRSID